MIYLDHAATTPVDKRVLKEMRPYFREKFGNASTLYEAGEKAKKKLEESRKKVAKVIGANPEEIIFTSGGTESDNLAIKGLAREEGKGHIITSKIEHHAVLNTVKYLEEKGFDVTYLDVDENGFVNPKDVKNAIREDTVLVTIMHANNEIGSIEPVKEIGRICHEEDVYFHTDAVQSFGKLSIDVNEMNIDLLSASSHKIYGPKGVGMLYKKKEIDIEPTMHGGGHENGLRSGTENVAGIVGFAKAAELADNERKERKEKEKKLRDKLVKEILKVKNSQLNGPDVNGKRLHNNANFSFKGAEGESIVLYLDREGIAASTGSACSTPDLEPSHVLSSIGLKPGEAHGSLRLTVGKGNTMEEIEKVIREVPKVIKELRNISGMG